jgi:hypothetical protein
VLLELALGDADRRSDADHRWPAALARIIPPAAPPLGANAKFN